MDFQHSYKSMDGKSMGILSQISQNQIKSSCKDYTFMDESLQTFLCEKKSVLNEHPLTSVNDYIFDFEPLTPTHLLIGEATPNRSPGNFREHELILRRNETEQNGMEILWKRWVREYLPILKIRRRWNLKSRNFKVGDLVIVMMKDMPRSHFRDVWRFVWCSSGREIKHSIGRNDQASFKIHFAWSQSRLIIRSHPLTGEGGCYVICNCKAANIDVVAIYLWGRLNYNLLYRLEKLIFQFVYILFCPPLFL